MPVGPCRVWYQNRVGETLGLAMSRSLGDAVAHKCGVSAEPEVFEHTTDPSDEFMVLATDGVFDVLDNQQVVQIAFNAMTASMQGNGGKDNRKAGGGGAAAGVPATAVQVVAVPELLHTKVPVAAQPPTPAEHAAPSAPPVVPVAGVATTSRTTPRVLALEFCRMRVKLVGQPVMNEWYEAPQLDSDAFVEPASDTCAGVRI
jgi:hypothetical protein